MRRKKLVTNINDKLHALIVECDELISIFVTSVKTAQKNKGSEK